MQEGLKITEYVPETEEDLGEAMAEQERELSVYPKQSKPITQVIKDRETKTEDAPETGTELITISHLVPADVFKKDSGHVDAILNQIKAKVRSEIFDISTEKGRTRIRAVARQIGSAKKGLKGMSNDLTDDWAQKKKIVTTEATRMEGEFDKFRDEHLEPLKAWEDYQENLKGKLDYLSCLSDFGEITEPTQEMIRERINIVVADQTVWGYDFEDKARREKEEVVKTLKMRLAGVIKREEEQAELARLLKAEEDRKLKDREDVDAEIKVISGLAVFCADEDISESLVTSRIDAVEKMDKDWGDYKEEFDIAKRASFSILGNHLKSIKTAQVLAAIAKQDTKDAEDKAANDLAAEKQETIERADYSAHMEREKISVIKWGQHEAECLRQQDQVHRKKINYEARDAIVLHVFENKDYAEIETDDISGRIIEAIAEGRIPHVRILY